MNISSANTGLFTIEAAKYAYPLNENQKVFTVLVTGLDAQDTENHAYIYSVTDAGASVTVRPADNDKIDLIVEKTVAINDTADFTFSVQRTVDNGTSPQTPATVSETLTAATPLVDVVEFNVTGLPKKNTDNPYVTYEYTYSIIECDENGSELTDTAHTFSYTSNETASDVSLTGKTLLWKATNITPPKYLYYKVLVDVTMTAEKVITMTHGKKVTKEKTITITKVAAGDALPFTLQRQLEGQTVYETVTTGTVGNDTLEMTVADSIVNSAGQTKSYTYRAVKADGTVYTNEELTLTSGAPTNADKMEYNTHYIADNAYYYAVGNGVRFENLPAYNSSGDNMSYGAYESPVEDFDKLFDDDNSLTTEQKAAKRANIHDYQIYGLYDTVKNDTTHYQTNGANVKEKTQGDDTTSSLYFYFKESEQKGTDNQKHTRHYLYQGSAQAYSKKKKNSTSTGARAENDSTPSSGVAPGVAHINMLNTLPLTAVTVQKHWDDQNNQFNLRPSAINDVNQTGNTVADKLNLTLYRRLETEIKDTDWKPIGYTEDANHQTEWYVHSYTNAQNQTVNGVKIPVSNDKKNEWTYTYYKLLPEQHALQLQDRRNQAEPVLRAAVLCAGRLR